MLDWATDIQLLNLVIFLQIIPTEVHRTSAYNLHANHMVPRRQTQRLITGMAK